MKRILEKYSFFVYNIDGKLEPYYSVKNCKNYAEEELTMKKDEGVTLIALVVTITVLIILAGISITSITGNEKRNY